MTDQGLTDLERAALEAFLGDDKSIPRALRTQLDHCRVVKRRMSGKGFFTELSVDDAAPPAPVSRARLWVRGVEADMESLNNGAGFLLLVTDGVLDTLEAYTYGEEWPQQVGEFSVHRTRPPKWEDA